MEDRAHSCVAPRSVYSCLANIAAPPNCPKRSLRAQELVLRAFSIMHRGVLPHLTRAILVMDWIGSSITVRRVSVLLTEYLMQLFLLTRRFTGAVHSYERLQSVRKS